MESVNTTRTYRATVEAWIGQLLLPLVFFVLLTVTAINATGLNPWVGGIGLVLLALIAMLDYALPMLRNWLMLDERSIEGSLSGRYFHVYWSEVIATWSYERRRRRFLCLGTREGTLVIPLRFFNDSAIWQRVRYSVAPEALEEKAIHRLPDYQHWEKARVQAMESRDPRTVTDHWLIQVIGWAGITFFLYSTIDAIQNGHTNSLLIYFILAIISSSLLLNWGITEFNESAIERYTLFGGWKMRWEDIRWIEIDPMDSVVVLGGDDCQLVIPGPGIWSGSNKRIAVAMLLAQAEKRHIPLRRTAQALLRVSRNTRARR